MKQLMIVAAVVMAVGCGPAFQHGPLGPAAKTAAVTGLAEAWRDQLTKQSAYGECWTVFVAADGLAEVRCAYPFVPEGVQVFRKCVDPDWGHGLMLTPGLIVACGRPKR